MALSHCKQALQTALSNARFAVCPQTTVFHPTTTTQCCSSGFFDHAVKIDTKVDTSFRRYDYRAMSEMKRPTRRGSQLRDSINQGRFYDSSEAEIIRQVKDTFPDELERLKNALASERGSAPAPKSHNEEPWLTPSEILYGRNYDEINRTLTGVLCLKWIQNDDYTRFTVGQGHKVKLTHESFDWLRDFFSKHIQNSEDLFTLILSMIVNDLGKDPDLVEDVYSQTNKLVPRGSNHDAVLLEAAKVGLVPCLDLLDTSHREDVMLGLQLGSELNAGQLAQAENVPINLEGLLEMKGHEYAFNLKFMEQILDVAGGAGHYDHRGSRNFIEPVFQAFKTVYEVALEIIAGNCTLRQGYDKVLTKRGDMLHDKGFRRLSVSDSRERALLRLLTMGRTASSEQAELFCKAFDALDEKYRELLVDGLNIDGNDDETAVLPYYMPAMLSELLENTKLLTQTKREHALTALMRYLARVLVSTEPAEGKDDWIEKFQFQEGSPIGNGGRIPGIVIERNMMKARETISGPEFRKNPDILNDLDIPNGQVLQRRRTSHSL